MHIWYVQGGTILNQRWIDARRCQSFSLNHARTNQIYDIMASNKFLQKKQHLFSQNIGTIRDIKSCKQTNTQTKLFRKCITFQMCNWICLSFLQTSRATETSSVAGLHAMFLCFHSSPLEKLVQCDGCIITLNLPVGQVGAYHCK